MPRPKREVPATLQGELNVDRLGLVSAMRTSRSQLRAFEVKWGEQTLHIEISSHRGIPCGADGDVLLGIQTLFRLAGCPENGEVKTSAHELLATARLPINGMGYTRLRESLRRLTATTIEMRNAWFDATTAHVEEAVLDFHILDEVRYRQVKLESKTALKAESPLVIRLSRRLGQGLRLGHYALFDPRSLEALSEPAYRTLYRFLLVHSDTRAGRKKQVNFTLKELSSLCGLGDRTDHAGDALRAACERFVELGLLQSYLSQGTGKSAQWTFVFPHATPENSGIGTAMALLNANRVIVRTAEKLALQHPESFIEKACMLARSLEERGREGLGPKIKSLAGLTVSILARPDHFPEVYGKVQDTIPAPQVLQALMPIKASSKVKPVPAEVTEAIPFDRVTAQNVLRFMGRFSATWTVPAELSDTDLKQIYQNTLDSRSLSASERERLNDSPKGS